MRVRYHRYQTNFHVKKEGEEQKVDRKHTHTLNNLHSVHVIHIILDVYIWLTMEVDCGLREKFWQLKMSCKVTLILVDQLFTSHITLWRWHIFPLVNMSCHKGVSLPQYLESLDGRIAITMASSTNNSQPQWNNTSLTMVTITSSLRDSNPNLQTFCYNNKVWSWASTVKKTNFCWLPMNASTRPLKTNFHPSAFSIDWFLDSTMQIVSFNSHQPNDTYYFHVLLQIICVSNPCNHGTLSML